MLIFVAVILLGFVRSQTDLDDEALDLGEATSIDKLDIITLKKQEDCQKAAKIGDKLTVNYVGYLLETGEEIANTFSTNEPFKFRIGEGKVMKGWEEGLLGMCEGERRKLFVPPELAFGKDGLNDSIPPNASLMYIVDLLVLKDKPKSGRLDPMERAVNKAHTEGRKEFKRMATGDLMSDGGRYIEHVVITGAHGPIEI